MVKIDIGCGPIGCGDINLDVVKYPCVNCVSSAEKIPYNDEYFDHVYSAHLLEHFWENQIDEILTEWTRILKWGGIFEIKVPNLQSIGIILRDVMGKPGLGMIYGETSKREIHMLHKTAFGYRELEDKLRDHNIVVGQFIPFKEQALYWYDKAINRVVEKYPEYSREIYFKGIKTKNAKRYRHATNNYMYSEVLQLIVDEIKKEKQ